TMLADDHHLIICGNDSEAKREVTRLLGEWFGWKTENIIDLGDISCSRGTEMYLALWIRLWGALGTPHFNLKIVREK
ncbi:MAG TPA: NADP oxidoreductase, partial [Chthoniobacteraceae bacterium]